MSFNRVEEYLEKTEALQNYHLVVRENNELRKKIQNDKTRYERIIDKLEKRLSTMNKLRIIYDKDEYGLEELDRLVEKKAEKWKENELQRQLDKRWSENYPTLLERKHREEIDSYPRGCSPKLRELIKQKTDEEMNSLLSNRIFWPAWFRNVYWSEVKKGVDKGLDEEFDRKVKVEAGKELQRLINVEWPKYIEEKITPICKKSLTEQIHGITRPIEIICDRCGIKFLVELTYDEIARLIKRPRIHIPCLNTECRGIFGIHAYNIPITLGQVIQNIAEIPFIIAKPVKNSDKGKDITQG